MEIELSSRSMARLLAVQALYQMEQNQQSTQELLQEFLQHRIQGKPDIEFFQQLVTGVTTEQETLDNKIQGVLRSDWSIDRLSSVVRAILRSASYELLYTTVPKSVVINEYVEIAKQFYNQKDVAFVNAALDKI